MNRWKVDKYGFVNFWLFDREEIKTSEGNLLLNGENGSGKSITLQSFIPLIFDGDLSSRNLSTEGDSSRKIDYYLSYGGKKEGISYLYAQLTRVDSSGKERYINLIIGMRARNGSLVSKWFVITRDKRVGKDFFLYKSDGNTLIPYDKQSLKRNMKNKIDGYYDIYEKPQEYKEAVNKDVFGFGNIDEYDETLNLIRKLRKPDLKENGSLDPKKIYEILNSSLKRIPENQLRGMTDTLENIEKISTDLKVMRSRLSVLKEIKTDYETYKKIILAKRLGKYFKVNEDHKLGKEKYERDVEKKSIKEKKLEKSLEKSERLSNEMEAKVRELSELENSDGNTLINRLINCKDDISKLEKLIENLDKEIQVEEEKIKALEEKKVKISKSFEDSRLKCLEKIEGLKKLQKEIGLDWEIDYYEVVKGRKISQIGILNDRYKEHEKNIEKLKKLIKDLNTAEKQIEETDRRLEDEKIKTEKFQNNIKEIEIENTKKVVTFLDIFDEKFVELDIDYKTIREFQDITEELTEEVMDNQLKNEVIELFKKIKNYREEELSKDSLSYERSIEKLQEEIDEKVKEKTFLENTKDSEIELLSYKKIERNKINKEQEIELLPLYKCIRFKDGVEEGVRGRIERALWEMGILDALVNSDDKIFDRFVATEKKVEKNLTSYIEIEEGCKEKERVLNILEAISTMKTEETYITEEGEYRNKVIKGRIDRCKGIYIGIEARRKQRELDIEKLKKDIAILVEKRDLLEESREETMQSITILQEEHTRVVNKYFEIFDPIYREYQKTLTLLEGKKNEIYELEERLSKKREEKESIRKDIDIKGKQLNISIERENYLILDDILKNFKRELDSFRDTLEANISYGNNRDNILESMDNTKKLQDKYRVERRISINKKNEAIKSKNSLEEEVNSRNLDTLKNKISDLRNSINKDIPNKKSKNDIAIGQLQSDIENLDRTIVEKREELEKLELAKNIEENLLKLEVNQDHNISEGEIVDFTGKTNLYERYRGYEGKREQHYMTRIDKSLMENGAILKDYRIEKIEYGYEDLEALVKTQIDINEIRYIIKGNLRGSRVHLGELYDTLDEMIKIDNEVLTDEEGKFFSDLIFDYLYKEVAGRIKESNEWVGQIDKIMLNAKTNSGKRYSLEWKPKDLQFGFNGKKLKEHIENIHNPSLKGAESREALKVFFKKKMDDLKKRAEDNKEYTSSYDIIKEILDYRKWYDFKMKVADGIGEKPLELTKRKLNSYSGGEKAMAMYIPLFSALYARFKNASGKAPIILGMDEAFSVVDDENISKLFEILEDLNINYLLASQKLSGTYHSVNNLAIVHIENVATKRNLSPEDAYVTLIKYIWNGRKKIKDSRGINGSLEETLI